ncbi:hypothetical protein [Psychroserpens damuponensis]|uniref:hypothetical protein n=1 Tax=Psychroserpens damuponensis TaxID=943936 RepID=UPI000ACD0063|nr:hypothetical protein [Psychroserpens damuponensis]
MSLFKQRKSKSFNYIPRNQKSSRNDDEHLKTQWEAVKRHGKHRSKRAISLPLLLVILGMIIALWYLLTHYQTT